MHHVTDCVAQDFHVSVERLVILMPVFPINVKCTSISVAPSLSLALSPSLSLSLVWCGGFLSLLFSVAFAILSLWCGGVVSLLFLLMTLMSARYPQNCGVTAPL